MTAAGLDAPFETMTPLIYRSRNDGVIQLSPLSSSVVLQVVKISHAHFVHLLLQYASHSTHYSQLHLNPANLEATVEAERILTFLFLQKQHFSMMVTITSSLRSVVQVLMGHFTIFKSHKLSG